MDYFIHKNLGGFLRRELDFYIKNEVMRLDHIESAEAPAVADYLEKVKVIRRIARRIIEFLAQLEDFQKKLWLKKKFVTETNYCITLDRIPEEFYPEIAANERQIAEWERLYSISNLKEYSNPLTVDFLKNNPFLALDTAKFEADFYNHLISNIANDSGYNGTLIQAENLDALLLMKGKWRERIKGIYIDPPCNTDDDGFAYKDTYKHSSWLSMLHDRVSASRSLLKIGGLFASSIDRDENRNYLPLLFTIFSEQGFIEECVWQKSYGGGFKTKHINNIHEYLHIFSNDKSQVERLEQPPNPNIIKYYKYSDNRIETRGKYRLQPLNSNSNDFRSNLTFPLPIPDPALFGSDEWERERERIRCLIESDSLWLEDNGENAEPRWYYRTTEGPWEGALLSPPRQWQWSWDKTKAALADNLILLDKLGGEWSVNYKQYRYNELGEERGSKPPSLYVGPYTQAGTDEIRSLFGANVAKFIKPSGLVEKFISISYKEGVDKYKWYYSPVIRFLTGADGLR